MCEEFIVRTVVRGIVCSVGQNLRKGASDTVGPHEDGGGRWVRGRGRTCPIYRKYITWARRVLPQNLRLSYAQQCSLMHTTSSQYVILRNAVLRWLAQRRCTGPVTSRAQSTVRCLPRRQHFDACNASIASSCCIPYRYAAAFVNAVQSHARPATVRDR
jgi:hypothetical protein